MISNSRFVVMCISAALLSFAWIFISIRGGFPLLVSVPMTLVISGGVTFVFIRTGHHR